MGKLVIFLAFIAIAMFSCSSDTTVPAQGCDNLVATYNENVKNIIDQTCAYSGCHSGSGIAPGDYSSFTGLSGVINNGSFVNRVIDLAENPSLGMPPNAIIYQESQQDDLSAEQMEIIMCWIAAGFPEG